MVIENQLERTDHRHLGQLLTYAAGLEAVTCVWVASEFTNEHRAALDWLNNATRPEFNFFGLEIELWQIGDSPFAPKFNVVCQPNEWSKTLKEASANSIGQGGELSETQKLHLAFWTQFRQFLEERKSPLRSSRPSKDHWTNVAVGRTNFGLVAWNGMRDNRSGVYLQLTGPHAKAHFGLIEQRDKERVEALLSPLVSPHGELLWRALPNAKESQIYLVRPTTPSKRDSWPELNQWMAQTLETMHELFSPMVKTLNAEEYVPAETADEVTAENPSGPALPDVP